MSSSNSGTKSASADVPQIGAKMEELKVAKAEEPKIAASTQQGSKAEEPKIAARNNHQALESFFRSLHGDEPFVMTKSDTIFIGCYHDRIEDGIDDDSSSPGCHEEEEWIPVDRYVWKPQLDPKRRCIAAAPGDN